MSNKPVYVTKEGLQKLKDELEYLENTKKKEVADRIERAKEMGDLKENAEYHDAKDEMGWLMGRVTVLKDQIGRAEIVEKTDTDTVGIGSQVEVDVRGKQKRITVVGSTESDPLQGMVSNDSPIGEALIGKEKGDEVDVELPNGATVTYKILEIN